MKFNYSKLKGRIVEKFETNAAFAKAMSWSERTTSLKLNGRVAWRQDEICKALHLLGLQVEEVQVYFFDLQVQNIEQAV